MRNYLYSGSLVLNLARFRRIEGEREAERVFGFFGHHAVPHRELEDRIDFKLLIKPPRNLTEEENKIFENCLQELSYRLLNMFEHELREHHENKNRKESIPVDESLS